MIRMIRKALPAILGAIVVVLVSASCFAQDTDANQQESKESLSGKKATPRGIPKPEADSADIPPMARGRIDEETYLRLRDELVATKRGIFDLIRDPQARLRGVLQMNRQEELIRRLQSNLKASQGANGVIRPEFLFSTWSPLGPDPIPNGQTTGTEVPVSGRVSAIAIDPTDATGNTAYVGAAQGGLYFTQDGGTTWTALMDSAASLAIGAITIDPLDHNTVFVGTGEGNFSLDSFFGVGLYIIQGATTGAPTLSGPFNSNGTSDVFTGRAITQILVNPGNDNLILVSTVSGASGMSGDAFNTLPVRGVYLSTNALSGAPTFSLVPIQSVTNRAVTDMAMDPGNVNRVVVNVFGLANAGDGGIWVSTSGNPWAGTATWTQTITKQAIGKLAVNRSGATPATTFFATFDETVTCGGSSVGGTMSKSTNGGVTWVSIPAARGFCGGQCFYDMAPAIDPGNVNTIYLGGSANSGTVGSCGSRVLAKSTNGGTSFAASDSSLHADSHATAIAPGNHMVIYAGDDGGVFRSSDGGATWSSINTTGFNATQFESLAIHPSDPNFTIGGSQDNGTPFMMPDGTWTRADFGDGGFSAIDQSATDTTNVTMYHTYFNQTNNLIGFARVTSVASATEGSWGFFGCSGGISNNGIGCGDSVLFYAPMALGPGTPNTFYFGTDHLYRSVNQGTTMTSVSQSPLIAGSPNIHVSAIGIAAQDDNFRIVGMENGHVFATTTGSNTLTDVTGGWALKYIARAVIDPNNKNTAYVTLDGYGTPNHVWKTTNLSGAPPTWTAASSGLPDVPVNAFAVDPLNTNYLYAGTDIGVYNSIDGGATWNPYGLGLPRVAVFDLKEYRVLRKVRIATHGRGIWEITAVTNFFDTIGLVPNSQRPTVGTNVMLTATVDKGTGVPVPTGTVTFLDGANTLGTGSLDDSGTATFQTSRLSLGPHSLTATYSGDSLYAPGTSPAMMITVTNPPDFAVNVPSTTRTVDAGQSAAYAITLTPQNGFSAPVKFDCSGLPNLANCAFEPATLAPSGSDTTSILIISTTAHTLSAALPMTTIVASALTGFGLLGLVIAGCATGRKRLWQSGILLLIAVAMVTAVAGCNGHMRTIDPMTGTPAGAYSVTVTATSGSTTHQANVTLIVR